MKVQVCNVSRAFGAIKALDRVSFELTPGCLYGFVGPNGSGKTTLLRIMAGVDRPDHGEVLFDDVPVTIYPDRVRRLVGYMPDALPDFRDMRAWEYLDFFARSYGLTGARRRDTLANVEEFTGCASFRQQFLCTLSKGMKQRVSLARALLHHPRTLLLDEPAAGLDPQARYELRVMLKSLQARGLTIFLSSHILSELEDMCDGAVILKQGRLVAAGLMAELQQRLGGDMDAETAAPVPSIAPSVLPAASAEDVAPSQVTVLVRTLGEAATLVEALRRQPACLEARENGERTVLARLSGDEAALPEMLRSLLEAGIPVCGLERHEMGLEEMFMKYTARQTRDGGKEVKD